MTPYGAKPAYRTRVLSGRAPWLRAEMATLLYWCVLSTILVSTHLAKADIEFYPDERPGSSNVPVASRAPSSRQVPHVEGTEASEVDPPSSLDKYENTLQRQFAYNMGAPMSFNQVHNAEVAAGRRLSPSELDEFRQLRGYEAMWQQMDEQDILQQMMNRYQSRISDRQIGKQQPMQVGQIAMEKAVKTPAGLSETSPFVYADSRLKDIFYPLLNRRPYPIFSPSLSELPVIPDQEIPYEDRSMDVDPDLGPDPGLDPPYAGVGVGGGDVQHVISYSGGAVPIGLLHSRVGASPPPLEPKDSFPKVASPAPAAPPTPSTRSKSRGQLYGSNIIQMEDGTVAKKVLRMPDHWFLGMPDVYKLAIVIGCSVMGAGVVIGGLIWQYRLHRRAKAAADVDYPAYGVTGPSRDLSPSGDRRLAQSAQIYHYQHQKQQILSMEGGNQPPSRGSMSEAESEDENEEGDYTVYECPGLAPPGEMEVKNPMFDDDPATATPATPATPGSTTVGREEGRAKNNKGSPSSK